VRRGKSYETRRKPGAHDRLTLPNAHRYAFDGHACPYRVDTPHDSLIRLVVFHLLIVAQQHRLDATRAEWEEKVQGETANPLADMDVFDSETAGTTNEEGADAFESESPRDQKKKKKK
jgi:hypothetical protein